MKKLITFLVLFIALHCNAQVNIVETQSEKDVKVCAGNSYIYKSTYTNEYFLVVYSSHQNVRQYYQVKIKLGNNADEAIESIKQIEKMYENAKDNNTFTINEYKCVAHKGFIFGRLQFPQHEYENLIFDSVYYTYSLFGKLRICTLAIDKYNDRKF